MSCAKARPGLVRVKCAVAVPLPVNCAKNSGEPSGDAKSSTSPVKVNGAVNWTPPKTELKSVLVNVKCPNSVGDGSSTPRNCAGPPSNWPPVLLLRPRVMRSAGPHGVHWNSVDSNPSGMPPVSEKPSPVNVKLPPPPFSAVTWPPVTVTGSAWTDDAANPTKIKMDRLWTTPFRMAGPPTAHAQG